MSKLNFGAEFLRAEDLLHQGKWGEFTLTIKAAHDPNTVRAADKTMIDKPVIDFEKTDKRLVLGVTNQRLIKCATGAETTDDLIGKRITLFAVIGDWFGEKNVTAIRIRVPEDQPKPFIKKQNMGKDITGVRVVSESAFDADDPNEVLNSIEHESELNR